MEETKNIYEPPISLKEWYERLAKEAGFKDIEKLEKHMLSFAKSLSEDETLRQIYEPPISLKEWYERLAKEAGFKGVEEKNISSLIADAEILIKDSLQTVFFRKEGREIGEDILTFSEYKEATADLFSGTSVYEAIDSIKKESSAINKYTKENIEKLEKHMLSFAKSLSAMNRKLDKALKKPKKKKAKKKVVKKKVVKKKKEVRNYG